MLGFPRLWLGLGLLGLEILGRACAINKCSHSLHYEELCPHPSFIPPSYGSNSSPDMTIKLTHKENSSCQFMETEDSNDYMTTVGGIHVNEKPFPFINAGHCDHLVKIALERNGQYYGPLAKYGGEDNRQVCEQKQGMNVHDLVYLWHNITLTESKFMIEDLISNYGYSHSDLKCTHKPKYIIFLFLTSRNHTCKLLVQQYKVDEAGCKSGYKLTHDHRFCGAYSCSQANSILQDLKLVVAKRNFVDSSPDYKDPSTLPPSPKEQRQNVHHRIGPGSSPEISIQSNETVNPNTMSSTTETPSNDLIGESKPFDWVEWFVRLIFPLAGIIFIFTVLHILQGRYASQFCGRQGHQMTNGHCGSFYSMDKQGLSM